MWGRDSEWETETLQEESSCDSFCDVVNLSTYALHTIISRVANHVEEEEEEQEVLSTASEQPTPTPTTAEVLSDEETARQEKIQAARESIIKQNKKGRLCEEERFKREFQQRQIQTSKSRKPKIVEYEALLWELCPKTKICSTAELDEKRMEAHARFDKAMRLQRMKKTRQELKQKPEPSLNADTLRKYILPFASWPRRNCHQKNRAHLKGSAILPWEINDRSWVTKGYKKSRAGDPVCVFRERKNKHYRGNHQSYTTPIRQSNIEINKSVNMNSGFSVAKSYASVLCS